MTFNLTPDYAHIHFWFLYIGWNNSPHSDETFGLCIGNFYMGHYVGIGWRIGFLNKYGVLK